MDYNLQKFIDFETNSMQNWVDISSSIILQWLVVSWFNQKPNLLKVPGFSLAFVHFWIPCICSTSSKWVSGMRQGLKCRKEIVLPYLTALLLRMLLLQQDTAQCLYQIWESPLLYLLICQLNHKWRSAAKSWNGRGTSVNTQKKIVPFPGPHDSQREK